MHTQVDTQSSDIPRLTCTHIYMHRLQVYTHRLSHEHTQAHAQVHVHTQVHTQVYARVHVHTHIFTHTGSHTPRPEKTPQVTSPEMLGVSSDFMFPSCHSGWKWVWCYSRSMELKVLFCTEVIVTWVNQTTKGKNRKTATERAIQWSWGCAYRWGQEKRGLPGLGGRRVLKARSPLGSVMSGRALCPLGNVGRRTWEVDWRSPLGFHQLTFN